MILALIGYVKRFVLGKLKGIGIQGAYLFGLVGFLCVWVFSVPVEFRRARMCSEEQVRTAAPERNCMTFGTWRQGIADYYSNGGGVNFDFSVEGK